MTGEEIIKAKNRKEFRKWLSKNHSSTNECWVRVKLGTPTDDEFCYLDALEEALCFGWIDSTKKKLEDGTTIQRFSPRKSTQWTELNKERCRRLMKLGLMTDAGMEMLPDLDEPFVIDKDIEDALKEDPAVWGNFNDFPELYRKIRIDNIQRIRKDRDLFESRLEKLIETSRDGKMYGTWDDYGRLQRS